MTGVSRIGLRFPRRWWTRVLALISIPILLYLPGLIWEFTRDQPPGGPGGAFVSTIDHPWVVVIGNPTKNSDIPSYKGCVGTLVTPQAVVTAAHCLGSPAHELTVTAGRDDLRGEEGSTVAVTETWMSPGFREGVRNESLLGGIFGSYYSTSGDIGVIRLAEPLPYATLPMAASATAGYAGGTPAYRLGWRLSPEDEPLLWRAPVPVLDDEQCVDEAAGSIRFIPPRFHGATYDTDSYLCAGVDDTALPSRASDSGAPLIIDGKLAGVVAWAPGADPALPDYYTRVSHYYDEIVGFITTGSSLE